MTDETKTARSFHRARIEALLTAALAWLDVKQPEGALIQHHGIYANPGGAVWIQFAPSPPVVIFHRSKEVGRLYDDATGKLLHPMTEEEVSELRAIVEGLAPVQHTWNGVSFHTFSLVLALDTRESEASRLVATYHKGCLEHPRESVFCKCGWFGKGYNLAMKPEGWR